MGKRRRWLQMCGALLLAATICSCAGAPLPRGETPPPAESAYLRSKCDFLMSPRLLQRFYDRASAVAGASSPEEKRALLAPVAHHFRRRQLVLLHFRTVITLDVLYLLDRDGKDGEPAYGHLNLVNAVSGKDHPRNWIKQIQASKKCGSLNTAFRRTRRTRSIGPLSCFIAGLAG